MPATTPHVGVRAYFDRLGTAPFLIADMSTIGGAFTGANDTVAAKFPLNVPVHFTTDDLEMTTALGATGTLRHTIDAIISEGIIASVVAVRVAEGANIEATMANIVGSASARTGLYALLDAKGETGVEPDILIAPGYTSQRLGSAANPAATALDAICDRITTAVAVCDTPSANKTVAVEWAADFAGTLNVIAIGQAVRVSVDGTPVVRPASPHIAAQIVRTDKEKGAPYYNPGHSPGQRALKGILGPDRAVTWRVNDPDCEANYLIQRGVNSLVQVEQNRTFRRVNSPQGKDFWGFFNTSSDPKWRAINMVRTRKAVLEVIPRTLVQYIGRNLGAHLITTIGSSIEAFLAELYGLPEPAILPGWKVLWPRELNTNGVLAVGGSAFRVQFQEAPPLVDLQIFTEPHEASFDILASQIEAAMRTFNVAGQLYGAIEA